MQNLPLFISLIFGVAVVISVVWMYVASGSKTFLVFAVLWTLLQSVLGITEMYRVTDTLPPRLMLFGIFPLLALIAVTFLSKKGKAFMDDFDLKVLTQMHSVRIPVEVVLWLLVHQGVMAPYMSFEGTNFDLFSGLSAPLMAYIGFRKKTNKRLLLVWNMICLLLLLNVVITAIFSLPSPFQRLAFDQPNVAVLYFPYNLLPTVVVPAVLFAHLIAFRQLLRKR